MEEMDEKQIYVATCEELGISDFGENIKEALNNLKSALKLLLQHDSDKAELLRKQEPILTTRMLINNI
jgi:predicted RNase H-like HicB family nuclease